jgi:hypothetical protein
MDIHQLIVNDLSLNLESDPCFYWRSASMSCLTVFCVPIDGIATRHAARSPVVATDRARAQGVFGLDWEQRDSWHCA